MKQNFTILWIEDKERVITSQIPEIKRFLDSEGFQLNLLMDTSGDLFETLIQENKNMDIVVTDYNISEEIKGTDIIDYIRKNGLLIDILFYSVHEELFRDDEIFSKLGHYGLIETCDGKDVMEPLKNLIIKNIKRCQDIVFLRGFVISRSVELELKINVFIAEYFKIDDDLKEEFHNFVLESSYVPMVGKKKWLSQILEINDIKNSDEFKGLLTKLDNISAQRNLVAHCKKDNENPNIIVSAGKHEVFDKNRLNGILKDIDNASNRLDILIKKFSIEIDTNVE